MIYLKDEATGATVDDDGIALTIGVPNAEPFASWIPLSEAAADAVLRGLLRWKLETAGFQPTFDWCKDQMRAFLDERCKLQPGDL